MTTSPNDDSDRPHAPSLGLGTLPERFLLVYPIVFMLPFPLTLLRLLDYIPYFSESFLSTSIGWLIGLHGQATQPIIAWLGRLFTGEAPSFEFTGSGDGLASYLGVFLDVCIAAVIAFIWWLRQRSTPVAPRLADAGRVLLRYFLAWVMLSYGFSKVFPTQFSVMGPDRLLQPYGDSSPMGLLWTFMGASPGYQMFAGAAEVLGGLLLLFRRTTLLGALVVAAVMTNVFAMNVFFDVPVKLYSFHYLLFAAFLVIPDVPRLVGIFIANTPVAARDLSPFWGIRAAGAAPSASPKSCSSSRCSVPTPSRASSGCGPAASGLRRTISTVSTVSSPSRSLPRIPATNRPFPTTSDGCASASIHRTARPCSTLTGPPSDYV